MAIFVDREQCSAIYLIYLITISCITNTHHITSVKSIVNYNITNIL